jgi:hypothetical protein
MPSKIATPAALVISGDDAIAQVLSQKDAVVMPASAFRLDGFVNDTFTEYVNPSIYRPASVCNAGIVSHLQDVYQLGKTGGFYFGFTMYTTTGCEEPVEVWVGHTQVARAYNPDPDNRVHLFVVPRKIRFQGGELKRLITAATNGPYRIENLVLLPQRPTPTKRELKVLSPHVDVRRTEDGLTAYVTWINNRPASGQVRWGGQKLTRTFALKTPLANHEAVLESLQPGRTFRYEVELVDRTGTLTTVHKGRFRTDRAAAKSRVRKARIPIELRRPAPGPSTWPISVGVPFPEGALGDTGQISLQKGRTAIPVQARTLTRWDDGSIRWALLDFAADGKNDYAVAYGSQVTRALPGGELKITQSSSAITVTTGPLQVAFPKDRTVLPGLVSVRDADGSYRRLTASKPAPAVTLVADNGETFCSGKPEAVILEEAGPERACVRIDVVHTSGKKHLFRSTLRVHLFRNSSAIRVLHTFENDRTDANFTSIRSLGLRADLPVGPDGEATLDKHASDLPICLGQTHDNAFALTRGRRTVAKGKRSTGAALLTGESATVALSVKDFWQNYPKGLALDQDGITVQICPELDKKAYPRGGELEDRLYYYLLDGRYKFKQGASRTHEFWFHIQHGSAQPPADFHKAVQRPPLYTVGLNAFNKSAAVTRLPEKKNSPFPPYETWVEAARKVYAKDRIESRAYGMLNYGDWFGERVYNWGNMEYDTPWCFLQEYLRGGHADFYTWAEEAARHLIDVDTCHYHADSGEVGSQYLHSVGHVGDYYPEGYRERAIFSSRWSVSHTWVEGLFMYHLLTGDARALESAMKTSNLLVGELLNDYDFTNCRNSGWHLIHLAAAYKATGRKIFLSGARIIVDRVLERQHDTGGWERLMVPGHCFCFPHRHMGNAGFMVGVLMAGLKRFYEATGEKRVRDAVVKAAEFCIDDMWVPENRAFRYTSCPHSSVGRSADMGILKGIAAAYGFSGKQRLKDVLFEGVQSSMADRGTAQNRGVGKSISMPMRGACQVLVDLPGK